VVVSQAADPAAMFGPATQLVCLTLAGAGAVVFHRRRLRLDTITTEVSS
jgi:alpha-D-ribose 1-methylphosphonate 5-triphosphate synthase subunit PhnH